MVELLDYHPYGTERISWSSSSSDGEAQFAKTYIGEYSDSETDLSYLNARYYDPQKGQFLSQDAVYLSLGWEVDKRGQVALLDPQSQNGYLYGRGNPMTLADSEGQFWDTVFDVGFTFVDIGRAFYYEGKFLAALAGGDLSTAAGYAEMSLNAQTDILIDVGSTFIPFAAAPVVKKKIKKVGDVLRQVPVQKVELPYNGYSSSTDLNTWDR